MATTPNVWRSAPSTTASWWADAVDAPSELHGQPRFEPGTKVRALCGVRNDGTYPGVALGRPLIAAGEVGYVKSVGTYLNRFYVYSVDFVGPGMLVGMRGQEIVAAQPMKESP